MPGQVDERLTDRASSLVGCKPVDHTGATRATKYIFVSGGVVSSVGKGITVASIGRLLKTLGYVRDHRIHSILDLVP